MVVLFVIYQIAAYSAGSRPSGTFAGFLRTFTLWGEANVRIGPI